MFLANILFILISMFIIDRTLLFLDGELTDINRRYYVVHALANTVNVITTFPDLVHCLAYPLNIAGMEHNTFPMAVCIALHLHHFVIGYKTMTFIDLIHHLVNCFFVGLISTYYFTGHIINLMIFFICGLPGGIDYYLLSLKKYGMIDSMTEKYYNTILNMWIRVPGMLYTCFLAYINMILGTIDYHPFMICLMIVLNAGNALFFASRVVENYGESKIKSIM